MKHGDFARGDGGHADPERRGSEFNDGSPALLHNHCCLGPPGGASPAASSPEGALLQAAAPTTPTDHSHQAVLFTGGGHWFRRPRQAPVFSWTNGWVSSWRPGFLQLRDGQNMSEPKTWRPSLRLCLGDSRPSPSGLPSLTLLEASLPAQPPTSKTTTNYKA